MVSVPTCEDLALIAKKMAKGYVQAVQEIIKEDGTDTIPPAMITLINEKGELISAPLHDLGTPDKQEYMRFIGNAAKSQGPLKGAVLIYVGTSLVVTPEEYAAIKAEGRRTDLAKHPDAKEVVLVSACNIHQTEAYQIVHETGNTGKFTQIRDMPDDIKVIPRSAKSDRLLTAFWEGYNS